MKKILFLLFATLGVSAFGQQTNYTNTKILQSSLNNLSSLHGYGLRTFYVKNGGNDSYDGLTDATAWAHHPWMSTWTGSVTLAAGDVVCMKRGDTWSISSPSVAYMVVAQSGTSGYPITTTAYGNGAKPVIKIATNTDKEVISGYSQNYITFDNLQVSHYDDTYTDTGSKIGIAFGSGSHDWIITNCTINNCPVAGIYGSTTCYNITIGDINASSCATSSSFSNEIYDCGYAAIALHGYNSFTGRSDFNVFHNYIHDIDAYSVTDRDAYGIAFSVSGSSTGWPHYATARYNYIANIPGWTGLDTHGGQYIYFLDNHIYNCHLGISAQCVSVGALTPIIDNVYIQRNTIENPGNHIYSSYWFIALHGMSTTYRATNSYIQDNILKYTTAPTSETSSFGIKLQDANTVTISGNKITNGSASNSGGIQLSSFIKTVLVYNNWIYNFNPAIYIIPGSIDGNISIYSNIVNSQNVPLYFDSGTIGANTINIYGNTFYSQHSSDGYSILLGSITFPASSAINIKNNICGFTSSASAGTYITLPGSISGTFTCNYNLYYNSPYAGGFNGGTFATWQGLGHDANSVNASDPLLLNKSALFNVTSDFRLGAGSPAINVGTNTGITLDYFNRPRVGNYDIGAIEVQ